MMMQLLEDVRGRYEELLDRRMEDIKLPEEKRSMTEDEFKEQEERLNRESFRIKMAMGIAITQQAMLCTQCGCIYELRISIENWRSGLLETDRINECEKHKGFHNLGRSEHLKHLFNNQS